MNFGISVCVGLYIFQIYIRFLLKEAEGLETENNEQLQILSICLELPYVQLKMDVKLEHAVITSPSLVQTLWILPCCVPLFLPTFQ